MLGNPRDRVHHSRCLLTALVDARDRDQILTQHDLVRAVEEEIGRRAAWRTLRQLARAGLITTGPARTMINPEHLWFARNLASVYSVQYDVTLTDSYNRITPAPQQFSGAGPGEPARDEGRLTGVQLTDTIRVWVSAPGITDPLTFRVPRRSRPVISRSSPPSASSWRPARTASRTIASPSTPTRRFSRTGSRTQAGWCSPTRPDAISPPASDPDPKVRPFPAQLKRGRARSAGRRARSRCYHPGR
jgi:hypothetical protein